MLAGFQITPYPLRMSKTFQTVSDRREEKARNNGDLAAFVKDQQALAFQAARAAYLKANPDVGVLVRNGVEVFYRNLAPLHLGKTQEFTPASVIK